VKGKGIKNLSMKEEDKSDMREYWIRGGGDR